MNNEFKKSKSNNETRYTLESMTAGATGSGSVATATGSLGKVQKRGNILAQEAGKDKVPATTPRNFVAKNAKSSGAGAHKDKKKEQKQGVEKHKKPYMESLRTKIDQLKSRLAEQGVAEGSEQIYNILALDKGNALKKPTKLKWKASSLEDIFDALAAQDWYPLEINGVEVIAGKRLKQGVAEGSSDFVGNAIEDLRVSKPGLDIESFLDELYYYLDAEYGKQAADMVANAGEDQHLDWYDMYSDMAESAPPGWEKTVKAMKKHDEIDNPFALAWSMKNKGYKSHKKESTDPYFESLANKLDQLKKK